MVAVVVVIALTTGVESTGGVVSTGGGGGGGGGAARTGVTMSAWISAAASARSYTRTSSIAPTKPSFWKTVSLPIRSAPGTSGRVPASAREDASTPFTYSDSVLPSKV